MAPSKTKEPRKANFLKKVRDGNEKIKAASFLKRSPTLQKKAQEIQTLCDISVCLVCFGPDGSVNTFPEQESEVKAAILSYKGLEKNQRQELTFLEFLEAKKKSLLKKKAKVIRKKMVEVIEKYSKLVDGLYGKNLFEMVNFLEFKLMGFKEVLKSFDTTVKIGDEKVQEQALAIEAVDSDDELGILENLDIISENSNQVAVDGTEMITDVSFVESNSWPLDLHSLSNNDSMDENWAQDCKISEFNSNGILETNNGRTRVEVSQSSLWFEGVDNFIFSTNAQESSSLWFEGVDYIDTNPKAQDSFGGAMGEIDGMSIVPVSSDDDLLYNVLPISTWDVSFIG
ncbi:hypothetical protein JCGZ_19233 [Jatropha curcas]|uniref:MADS-box domain-containing protein n=2 Tax=Jatropha curcas TaxID=180498 RepID=A0A067KB74_JATCU|nr:hypothetical protein JCGZ_19233 [Jatropha curcas]